MPLAPNQLQKLTVQLRMWKRTEDRYIMITNTGTIPVANLSLAREYAERSGYSGIKVVPS